MTTRRDWSQRGEQDFILRALAGYPPGVYADIGAWGGTVFSNTRALYEDGWNGVLVEPSPGPFRDLMREYPDESRATLVNAACVTGPLPVGGVMPMHLTDDAVSSDSDKHRATWETSNVPFRKAHVGAVSVARIVDLLTGIHSERNAKSDTVPPTFVNIDTEGSSADVWEAWLQRHLPTLACIESDDNAARIISVSRQNGYTIVLDNGLNIIVRRSTP